MSNKKINRSLKLAIEHNQQNKTLKARVKEEVEKNSEQEELVMQKNCLMQMGAILNSIAYQWQKPLNRINANVAVIHSRLKCDTYEYEMILSQIKMIEKNTQYISDIIKDFINLFYPEREKREFVLQNGIKKVLKQIDLRIKNVELNIVPYKELVLFSFEKEYLRVIWIILNNAIDNFEFNATQAPQIDIMIKEYDAMVYLSICDNGGGIQAQNIDHIFYPYYTSKFAKEGTGLGLYEAKILIEDSMQGELQVKNHNDGACFEIMIPSIKRKSKCRN